MLWSFDPVKYWRAAPYWSTLTTRRSTCRPEARTTELRVGPLTMTRSMELSEQNSFITFPGSGEVARISTSPIVSRFLRSDPARLICFTSGSATRWRIISCATGRTSPSRKRPALLFAPMLRRMFFSLSSPKAGQVPDPPCLCRRLQFGPVRNTKLPVQDHGLFWPDTFEL